MTPILLFLNSFRLACYLPGDYPSPSATLPTRHRHPLFPLLALLLEKCELAMRTAEVGVCESVSSDVRAFVRHQHSDHKPLAAARPEVNQLVGAGINSGGRVLGVVAIERLVGWGAWCGDGVSGVMGPVCLFLVIR